MKSKESFLYFHLSIFGFILFVIFLIGYVVFWQMLKINDAVFLTYTFVFSATLIVTIIFLRQIVLTIDKEIQEKYKMQKLHYNELNNTYEGMLKALATALDLRDHGTWGHSARVVSYALAIGEQMNLNEKQMQLLTWGGFLHDIGKIGVSDSILLKEASLTAEEWESIRKHPTLGFDIVEGIDFLKEAAEIVLFHHERYDGNGYPKGLAGEGIPLLARVFTVADALDAMTSNRPYRAAWPIQKALEEIKNETGKQFCPEIVKAFEKIKIENLRAIQQKKMEFGNIGLLWDGLKIACQEKVG